MRNFEFKAGCICLDLVDTVSGRGSEEFDLLAAPKDIVRWAKASGGLTYIADSLPSKDDHLRLTRLREVVFRAAGDVLSGSVAAEQDVAELNNAASLGTSRAILTADGMKVVADRPLDALMVDVATDAISLLGTTRKDRLRRCPGCNMLFFDGSPPGRRKWCSSAVGCGNRQKIRKHRQRQTDVTNSKAGT